VVVEVMEQLAQQEYKVQQELLELQERLARLVRVLQEPPASRGIQAQQVQPAQESQVLRAPLVRQA